MKRKYFWLVVLMLAFGMALTACGGGGEATSGGSEDSGGDTGGEEAASSGDTGGGETVEIRYALWDSAQQPPYEECAAAFNKSHPNISIKFEQSGWDDYWANLQTSMVAGNAPDVFTNHLAKYPEFAAKEQIVDIQPLVERDDVPTDIYIGELAELWTREGKRYGLPKDWDTIAIFYNKSMFEEAGVDPAVMEDWSWNPEDGGTFEEVIAQLTLDANGNNGLSPDFDKENVVQFGFIPQGQGNGYGQTQWSHWAVSNGFSFQDNLWGTEFHYEDPALAETLDWYASLWLEKGYAPDFAEVSSLGPQALFQSGKGAMTTDGSWQIKNYIEASDFEVGFGKLPVGPEGRKSMFNGLADSIYVGTDHQEEAWEWVKFLASPACQNIVGEHAVVFPAIESGVENALAAHEAKGADVSAFTEQALDPEGTFLFPVADNASEVSTIMRQVEEQIYLGEVDDVQGALQEADGEVDALFQ